VKSFTTIQKDGTIFLFGGYSDLVQEYTHRIWKYLPESHSWTIEGNMLVNRMNFASALGICSKSQKKGKDKNLKQKKNSEWKCVFCRWILRAQPRIV